MNNTTVEKVKSAWEAEGRPKLFWKIHNCSLCDYPCGYMIYDDGGETRIAYNSGCYCTGRQNIDNRDWQDIVDQINLQTDPDIIKRYVDFWGLEAHAKPE